LFALNRFEIFQKKVTSNLTSEAYCFKADIKHYFQEVDREILLSIVKRKIADEKVIWLITQILYNQTEIERERERDAGDLITKMECPWAI
jgi:retron-type reverse transcriptase